MNVEGVEIDFEPAGDESFDVLADGRPIGRVQLVREGSGFAAYRVNGEAVQRPSPWGGNVTARFATRDLAARALLAGG